MKKLSLLLVAAVLASACSKFSIDVEKRKYRPGYSVSVSVDKKSKPVAAVPRAAVRESTAVNAAPLLPAYPFLADAAEQAENSMMPVKAQEPRLINKAQQTSTAPSPQKAKAKNTEPKKNIPSEKRSAKNGDRAFLLLGGLAAIISGAMLRLKVNRARKISHWAKNNKKKTWLAFVGLYAVLFPGALLSGMLLFANDFIITPAAAGVAAAAFVAACLLYPVKGAETKLSQHSYLKKKTMDLVLALSGFMLMTTAGNQIVADHDSRPAKLLAYVSNMTSGDEENNLNTFVHEKISALKKSSAPGDAGDVIAKILLTILAVAVFCLLLLLTAVLSCNLSCSGQEGAAAFVAIFGLALSIFLLVIMLKAIYAKPKT